MPTERALHVAEVFNSYMASVDAPGRCDITLSFETPELVQLLSVWRALTSGRAMPPRESVTAHTLRAFLPHVALLDVIAEDAGPKYRFRLMGTSIARVLGDHTGKFLDEALVSPYRDRWAAAAGTAVGAAEALRMVGRFDYGDHHLSVEFFIAPLEGSNGRPDAVLVVAYAKFSARHIFEPMLRNAISRKA